MPDVATGPDGRPLVSAELVVVTNKPRLGQTGSSNVTVRGVDPVGARRCAARCKIVEGRMFTPGTDEVIVGRRIARALRELRDRRPARASSSATSPWSATSPPDGSAFESEIWGDDAVLMPALDRDDAFQSVTFRMRDPAQLRGAQEASSRPIRASASRCSASSDFYSAQSELLANMIRFMGVFITADHGGRRDLRRHEHDVRRGRLAHARDRDAAGARLQPARGDASFMIESVFLALIGGVIGCLLALPINGITTSTTNFQSFSELAFAFRVTPAALIAGMIFAVLMGLAGGFFPALRAARQPLARTLREN